MANSLTCAINILEQLSERIAKAQVFNLVILSLFLANLFSNSWSKLGNLSFVAFIQGTYLFLVVFNLKIWLIQDFDHLILTNLDLSFKFLTSLIMSQLFLLELRLMRLLKLFNLSFMVLFQGTNLIQVLFFDVCKVNSILLF